jgi:hypothetical protein
MARFYPFSVVLLILLLAAPAAPVAAGTTPSAGPDAPPVTFNVVRLGLYPEETYDQVLALGNVAFLADNYYDSSYPPASYGNVDLYDIADSQNPHFSREISAEDGRTISDMDSDRYRLALGLSLRSLYSSIGALEVYDNVDKICWFYFDYDTQGMAYSVALDDLSVYVGVGRGLALLDFEEVNNAPCNIARLFPTSTVYDIAVVGDLLYLGQSDGVRVVTRNAWPPSEVAFYPTPRTVYHVAVSPANYIYAGTGYGLYIIDGASGQIVTHYLPNDNVTVAVDGSTAYVGTEHDLQVLDVSDPKAPKLIGDYVDPGMDFELSLSFDSGLVHSPKGIFKYHPDLLVEAQSTGVTVNNTPLASGSSVPIKPGDRITLAAPSAVAAMKVRCSANSAPEYPLLLRQRIASGFHTDDPDTVINVIGDLAVLGAITATMCEPQQMARSVTASPPLPLSLVTGPVQIEVAATAPAVEVDTTYAGSQAAGGTAFQAGHNPTTGESWFLDLTGALQVQPTAAGAPLLTLGPGQYVDVTAAGAGPVGQFRYVYLPLVLR